MPKQLPTLPIVAEPAVAGLVAGELDQTMAAPDGIPVHEVLPIGSAPGLQRVGDYELLEELGRGGMGVVYKARQIRLNRIVALKMILDGQHAGPDHLARFRTETEAIACLHNANIVQIYEVGEWEGRPFFSMEFVEGGSLANRLGGTPLSPRQAAQFLETLTRAIQAAHDRNIVHRDLKPGNILLQNDDGRLSLDNQGGDAPIDSATLSLQAAIPKITDFGLAKRLDDPAVLTRSNAIMGTPSYMAPEQAAGKGQPIGPAVDVYALGAILYELLTGRPPFKAATPLDTVLQVLQDDPVRPRLLQPKTPRDLETICLKAMAKAPGRRYVTAREMANDLRRFLHGEPIQARPVGRVERVRRWCQRNPAAATLIATVLAVLLVSVAVGSYLAAQVAGRAVAEANARQAEENAKIAAANARLAEEERMRADAARLEAEKERDRNALLTYVGQITAAQREWQDGNVGHARELLDACQWTLRGWEHNYLYTLFHTNEPTFFGHTGPVFCVAFSPDAKRIVSASVDKTAKVWDAATGQDTLTLKRHTDVVTSVAFSPDGKRLISGSWDGLVKVWDAATGQEILTLKRHTDIVTSVAFSPDGKWLVSAAGATVRVWDAQTGQEARTLNGHTGRVHSVAFSPDSNSVASACIDKTVKVWDATTGQEIHTLKGHTNFVLSVAFSPDGKRIASGSEDQTVKVWDAQGGQELVSLKGLAGPVGSVTFSPDSKLLAAGTPDGLVKAWDAATGQEALTFKGHSGPVHCVAFSRDGKRLVSGSFDKTIKVWDVELVRQRGRPTQGCGR